jgi:hypothetical protein
MKQTKEAEVPRRTPTVVPLAKVMMKACHRSLVVIANINT